MKKILIKEFKPKQIKTRETVISYPLFKLKPIQKEQDITRDENDDEIFERITNFINQLGITARIINIEAVVTYVKNFEYLKEKNKKSFRVYYELQV
jgi:hypothetical protein